MCTYDDVPAPPSSAHWVPVSSPTFEAQSVCLAVAFDPTGQVGWAGAGTNGKGVGIIQSTDAGKTWASIFPAANATGPSLNMFLATAAQSTTSAVVSGILDQMYTSDGTDFVHSTNGFLAPAQDAQLMPGGKYALVMSGGPKTNGVGVSSDGGKTWSISPIGLNVSKYTARYGAFPSPTTWYVTAGSWAEQSASRAEGKRATPGAASGGMTHLHSHHITIHRPSASHNLTARFALVEGGAPAPPTPPALAGYHTAVAKTTDGGQTWSVVYRNDDGGLSPNGIHCIDESTCVAALEGTAGARILLTRDGGASWTESLHDADPKSSLMSVKMLSATEAWVSGGHMSRADFEGRFWHTTDGGKTWQKEAIKGLYVISFDLISKSAGFAVALTLQSGVQLLRYRQPGPNTTTTTTDVIDEALRAVHA